MYKNSDAQFGINVLECARVRIDEDVHLLHVPYTHIISLIYLLIFSTTRIIRFLGPFAYHRTYKYYANTSYFKMRQFKKYLHKKE